MSILITDPVDKQCVEIFKSEGFDVNFSPGLPIPEIEKVIGNATALIVRSQTQVTAKLLDSAKQLKVIGRAGAGVDNIDVEAASRRGIIVMNTPGGNTISTAEHTISMLLSLARNIPQANKSLQDGKWDRKTFVGTELFQKTIGVVGLGKVGAEVAKRCLAFEMNVVAFDPVLSLDAASKMGVQLVDLNELFHRSDFITIHSPLTSDTKNLIDTESLRKCKRGVRIINCARGGIVNEEALFSALESGIVAGAALDVFEKEPPGANKLILHPRVVCTPHLGASTEEAQEKVALQIAHQVTDYLNGRGISGSVNADILQTAMKKELRPYLDLAEKIGKLLGQVKEGTLKSIQVTGKGPLLGDSLQALSSFVVKGMFEKMLYEPVNVLNATLVARERGINVQLNQANEDERYSNVITVRYQTDKEQRSCSGTVFGADDLRIVEFDGFHFEIPPEGNLLIYYNIDRPGMLAKVSTILADGRVNIAGLSLGRIGLGEKALTIVATDTLVSEDILRKIALIEGVSTVRFTTL